MNNRLLKHLAVVAALAASSLSVPVSNAAVVVGSRAQIVGGTIIDATGNVTPQASEILGIGNAGPTIDFQGYRGYNKPNLLGGYAVTFNAIVNAPFAPFVVLQLPAITISGAAEPGPEQEATSFLLRSWTITQMTPGGFFTAIGLGDITSTATSTFLSAGRLQFSSQEFTPSTSDIQSYSATLTAITAIPVPGAMWIFGSGLLLMSAVTRRKSK
jgi:hypothetical protein